MPRPTTLSLTPTALDANGLSVSQTPAAGGAQIFTMTGALTTYDSDANGVMTDTTITAAGSFILTVDANIGAQTRHFTTPMFVTLTSAGDDSTKTFVLTGIKAGQSRETSESITGTNAGRAVSVEQYSKITDISVSAATAAGLQVGTLGATEFSTPQHITNVAAGNDAARTITVVGTDRRNQPLTATMAGGNISTVATTENFKTVTKVSIDADSAGALEIGIDGTCESGWLPVSRAGGDFNIGFSVNTSGAGTMKVEHTFDNVLDIAEDSAIVLPHESVTAATATADGNYTNPPAAIRLSLTAYTSGTASLRVIQAGR